MSKERRLERREERRERRDDRRDARQEKHEQRKEDGTTFGQRVLKAVASPILAPLLILKPVMRNALEEKGMSNHDIPDQLEPLARLFYDVIIKKNPPPAKGEKQNLENLIGEAIGAIVDTIVGFFKKLKDKKDSGEKLSSSEEKMLNAADAVGQQARDAMENSVASDVGKSLLDNKMLILVAVAVVVFIVIKKI